MANALQAASKRSLQNASPRSPRTEPRWQWVTKPCPLCDTEVRLKFVDDIPTDWLDTLSKNVACDWCADGYQDRENAESKILEIAGMLLNSNPPMEAIRNSLEVQTKKFAEACRKLRRASDLTWSWQFVDIIVEKPQQVWRILRKYEQGIAKE